MSEARHAIDRESGALSTEDGYMLHEKRAGKAEQDHGSDTAV